MRPIETRRIAVLAAVAIALAAHGAEPRVEIMDMVHHNPGEPFTRTVFTDPASLAEYGYGAMVVNEFAFPQCAVTFDAFDGRVFPEGSKERAWVMAARDRMREKCRECHAAGLKCHYFMDIIVLPKRLVELHRDEVCGQDGRISFSRQLTRELHRVMLHGCTVVFKGYEAERKGLEPDRALIARAASDYDRAWADFHALRAERPDCASLFRDGYPFPLACTVTGGIALGDGFGDSVRRYADRILTDKGAMHVR